MPDSYQYPWRRLSDKHFAVDIPELGNIHLWEDEFLGRWTVAIFPDDITICVVPGSDANAEAREILAAALTDAANSLLRTVEDGNA